MKRAEKEWLYSRDTWQALPCPGDQGQHHQWWVTLTDVHLIWCDENGTFGPLLKNTWLWCNHEKKNRQINEDTFYQVSNQYSSKSLRSSRWLRGKEPTCQCRRHRFNAWVGKIPWRGKWQPTLVFSPGESHGHRRLVGYSPWGHKESDTSYWLNREQQGEKGKSEKLSWQRGV